MKKLTVFILLFIFSACHKSNSDLADVQLSRYAKKAYQEKGLVMEGSGGSMMTDIKELTLSFSSSDHLTLDETRKLVVQIIDEFLQQVNADKEICPRLHTPFTAQNISLMIGFRNREHQRPPKEYIALAYTSDGKIYYSHWDSEKLESVKFCDHTQESINDAVKIVMEQEHLPHLQALLTL